MASKNRGLGKGLEAIFADTTVESGTIESNGGELPIDEIKPNPGQPRSHFDEDGIADLADSIKKEGLLQPIIVRPITDGGYQIIAGERRWQASKQAGLKKVPVRIMQMDDTQTLRVALIENLQRNDLNPIEEARGYKDLMKVGGLTQAQLAESVSKSRSAVANAMRLLDLPDEVQELMYDGKISAGHARAILSVPEDEKRIKFGNKIAEEKLSVREAENLARLYAAGDVEREAKPPAPRSFKTVAKELRRRLDTGVRVKSTRGKNKIEIEFKDEDDLLRIFKVIKNEDSAD